MEYPSYYSLEELLVQRNNCIKFGMNTSGIEVEIALVADFESVAESRSNHPNTHIFDQDA